MNKTLWDYSQIASEWIVDTQDKGITLCHHKNSHFKICDAGGNEYTVIFACGSLSNSFCMGIKKSLPLDKQINLLNAFIEAYS